MFRMLMLLSLLLIPTVGLAQQAPIIKNAPADSKSLTSPAKSLVLFFDAVSKRDYAEARKFLPRDIIKMVENNVPGGFEAFINEVEKENSGNKLVVNNEKIEQGKAEVETVTITSAGKRFTERWVLRLEDDLWKLDIFRPR